jgi:dipeptidyl aminopeptidase/acylaminoacyl peptidase
MPHFLSGDKPIQLDHYPPNGSAPASAVLLLHGSGGPLRGLDPFARQAAGFGVHVFALHYFQRTGHSWVYPSQIEENFLDWLRTAEDAVTCISNQPGVDPRRIGMLGFSLGGYLAVSLATQDRRIAAVAELFGGLPANFAENAAQLPPVLILHGGSDPIVPVTEAYQLEQLLKTNNIPYEMRIYPDQGHHFNGLVQLDAVRRVAGFFRKHLQRAA